MGLDTVELIISIEKHYNFSMADSEAEKIVTVSDLVNYTFELQKKTKNEAYNAVQNTVIKIIHETQGIPYIEITLGSRIVEDLGMQ